MFENVVGEYMISYSHLRVSRASVLEYAQDMQYKEHGFLSLPRYTTNPYEFTSSGILCTNHINCRDQLCVNLDTGELIHESHFKNLDRY